VFLLRVRGCNRAAGAALLLLPPPLTLLPPPLALLLPPPPPRELKCCGVNILNGAGRGASSSSEEEGKALARDAYIAKGVRWRVGVWGMGNDKRGLKRDVRTVTTSQSPQKNGAHGGGGASAAAAANPKPATPPHPQKRQWPTVKSNAKNS